MITKSYPQLRGSVYEATMNNGLKLFVFPKHGFKKVFMSLNVDYGSIDTCFKIPGSTRDYQLPSGIAHFLEHKMFDKQKYDVDTLFSQNGASSNAFTSFTTTNYVVETSDPIQKDLTLLLDFVQQPYFTAEKVAKEKGIIEQEIKMYQDDPSTYLYNETLKKMYPDFPLNQDVTGTVDSIAKIQVADLNLAYQAFYQPSNMQLVIAGDVNFDEVNAIVQFNQDKKQFHGSVAKAVFSTNDRMINQKSVVDLNLAQPMAAIGVKGMTDLGWGQVNLKNELILNVLLNLLLSSHSKLNASLYQQGIIDDSFGFELENERHFYFAFIASDTDKPVQFIDQIQAALLNAPRFLADQEAELQLIKREMIGERILDTDSLESLVMGVGSNLNDYANLYDEIKIIDQIQLSDLIKMALQFFKPEAMTGNIIK